MGRAKSLLLLLMVLLFSFATYNLVAMIMDHKADGLESLNRKMMVSGKTNSKFLLEPLMLLYSKIKEHAPFSVILKHDACVF